MASSRIFIRGLPPSFKEDDFRKHFSQRHSITDAKLFPQRRIGYVGYRSADDATSAVKYFNKTFVKMSRIAVELAKPVAETVKHNEEHAPNSRRSTSKPQSTDTLQQNSLKRKRAQPEVSPADPKLTEYLDLMSKKSTGSTVVPLSLGGTEDQLVDVESEEPVAAKDVPEDASDDEYQQLQKRRNRDKAAHAGDREVKGHSQLPAKETATDEATQAPNGDDAAPAQDDSVPITSKPAASDADWLRSRTSRLLGLLDEEEEADQAEKLMTLDTNASDPHRHIETEVFDDEMPDTQTRTEQASTKVSPGDDIEANETAIRDSARLFLRNLAYDVSEDDLRNHFAVYGELEEVHMPMDSKIGKPKGVAYVQFLDADSAVSAYNERDGETFWGRLLHILPAASKRESKLDEYAISKLPLKKQKQIRKRAEAAASTFSWNSLYMNPDAVITSVADRLGVEKSAVLDPTSSDAAVKQAVAETHVIQETKSYFLQNGVDVEAFKRSSKGDTTILVKNFSYGTKLEELRKLFEEHGQVIRCLMPPSGTIAIVEFAHPTHARAAFASLAYRKLKDSVLFLEKAPKHLFKQPARTSTNSQDPVAPVSASDLMQSADDGDQFDTTTLFVKNLNFSTSSTRLTEAFEPLDGFMSARVKTKTNPKQPQEPLSMGFGFVEFRSKSQAKAAVAAMDGYSLDGHQLVIRASQKGLDAADERRREDRAKKLAAQKSKIVVKNLPFETSKKDVRALLKEYGQLRTVRVPKKFDSSARGFAFAEFTTSKEAANAIEALRNTHLLGRKLVIEYAAEDPEDAEAQIERMKQKVGAQTSKVALQGLLGANRQKFSVGSTGEAAEDD